MTAPVLEAVAGAIREVVGEDWIQDEPILMDTSFAEDLELESIEFVALAEVLQELYGERVDFVAWISKLELDEIIQLNVGQVVWVYRAVPLVTASSIQMHTQTLGSGPPVFMLHGLLTGAWRPGISRLRRLLL